MVQQVKAPALQAWQPVLEPQNPYEKQDATLNICSSFGAIEGRNKRISLKFMNQLACRAAEARETLSQTRSKTNSSLSLSWVLN